MTRLADKTAVITGGNSGIGLATARRFLAEGARVVLFGRNPETLAAAEAELDGEVLVVRGDVTRTADLDRLYAATVERFGSIDILFVNAGIARVAPLSDVTEDLYDELFDINVKGVVFTVQRALPHLADGASIVLNGSGVIHKGWAGMSLYSATKAAVRSLARTLSAELLPRGIRVNTVSPGPIDTPIYGRMGLPAEAVQAFGAQVAGQVPAQRFGAPDEIADAVLFLSSPASSYVVGVDLAVDGGLTQL